MAHPPPQGAPTDPRPARPPLDPVALRRAGRATTRFGLLALATVLAASLPLPWGLAALAFGVAALAAGIVALVATVRARVRPAPVVVLSAGLALVVVLLFSLLVQVVFYPVSVRDQECRSSALTAQARDRCVEQQRQGLLDQVLGR